MWLNFMAVHGKVYRSQHNMCAMHKHVYKCVELSNAMHTQNVSKCVCADKKINE